MNTTQATTIQKTNVCANGKEAELIGETKVDSGEMSSLVVGIFEDTFPEPEFHIDVTPKNASVNASLVRIDDGAEYKLTYNFQNFQSEPCTVTVRACNAY
jgi:hypothetical protein